MASLPSLVLKIGVSYLKFKSARKKGVKIFRKELKDSGLSKNQIAALTKQYEDIGKLRRFVHGFSFFGDSG